VTLFLPEEAGLAAIAEKKRKEDLTEEDQMALLGRPRLGDITRAQIRVKESKEFKVRTCSN
jgi:solute carrier family 8 (sodium/calcium exchanger)